MAGLSLVQTVGTSRQRGELADQERANQALQAQIAKLSGALGAEQDLALARQGLTAALAGDVSWPRVLEDLAGTLPEGVWLTSFNLQPAGGTAGSTGSASFAATAFDFPAVAAWLDRLPRIPYYLNLFVSSATKSEGGPRPLVTFTSSAGVGPAARSDRLQRILEPER
jgi:Tfp pilus assembly protein PilN